ncbi:MAG: cyclic nucleotide-binding domain-containing protein [Oscillatoria sp. PMC 1068.18]|nr:cyclic nucleotide-binding domain-containing protein [Oscillatoria sp. PMC 1076.18]MEC4987173.1 cyclic nucleotide-binding domain-containing protein [Oscillatoria sp. PMC 1068.18]
MLSSFERLLFIRRVSIFQELRDEFLVQLASAMDEVAFPLNHTIFEEGEEGRSLYIVVSGRVKVHLGDRELAQLEKGTFFGEMSLFDAQPRSASVTTLDKCDCLTLNQLQLQDAIEETPEIAVNITRALSRRIRELNSKINAYEAQLQAGNYSKA